MKLSPHFSVPIFPLLLSAKCIVLFAWLVDSAQTWPHAPGLFKRSASLILPPLPLRSSTCWCPLEARASPMPAVQPNQGRDRGELACEITPLSCSHSPPDTLHPLLPFLHRISMAPLGREKRNQETTVGEWLLYSGRLVVTAETS